MSRHLSLSDVYTYFFPRVLPSPSHERIVARAERTKLNALRPRALRWPTTHAPPPQMLLEETPGITYPVLEHPVIVDPHSAPAPVVTESGGPRLHWGTRGPPRRQPPKNDK